MNIIHSNKLNKLSHIEWYLIIMYIYIFCILQIVVIHHTGTYCKNASTVIALRFFVINFFFFELRECIEDWALPQNNEYEMITQMMTNFVPIHKMYTNHCIFNYDWKWKMEWINWDAIFSLSKYLKKKKTKQNYWWLEFRIGRKIICNKYCSMTNFTMYTFKYIFLVDSLIIILIRILKLNMLLIAKWF